MITSEIIQQVYAISFLNSTATAFTVRVDNKQYLITAKHVLEDGLGNPIGEKLSISIKNRGAWVPYPVQLVGVGDDQHDIVVLAGQYPLVRFPEIELGTIGMLYGQEVYFLGFPFGFEGNVGEANNHYPFPYVKKAVVSLLDGMNGVNIVLDGINNKGFSGGPVAFKNSKGSWQIAGVIAGYTAYSEPVIHSSSQTVSPYIYMANTGLINACPIAVGLDLIKQKPIGCSIE